MGGKNYTQPPAAPSTTTPSSYSIAAFLDNQPRFTQNYAHVNPNQPGTSRMGLINCGAMAGNIPMGFHGSIDPRTYAHPGGSIVQGTPGHVHLGRTIQPGIFDQRNIPIPAMMDTSYPFGNATASMLSGFPLVPHAPRPADALASLMAPGNPGNLAHLLPQLRPFLSQPVPQLSQPSNSIFPQLVGNPLDAPQGSRMQYPGTNLAPNFAAEWQNILSSLTNNTPAVNVKTENEEVPITPVPSLGIGSTPSPHSSQISPNYLANLQMPPARTTFTPEQHANLLATMTHLHGVLRVVAPQIPLSSLPTPLANPFGATLPATVEMPEPGFRKPANRKKNRARRVAVAAKSFDAPGFNEMLNFTTEPPEQMGLKLTDGEALQRAWDILYPGRRAPTAANSSGGIKTEPSLIAEPVLPSPTVPSYPAPRDLPVNGTRKNCPGFPSYPAAARHETLSYPATAQWEISPYPNASPPEAPCYASTFRQESPASHSDFEPPVSTSAVSSFHAVDTQPEAYPPAAPSTPATESEAPEVAKDDASDDGRSSGSKLRELRDVLVRCLGPPTGKQEETTSSALIDEATQLEGVASGVRNPLMVQEPIAHRRRDSTPVDEPLLTAVISTTAPGSPEFVTSATSSSSVANTPVVSTPDDTAAERVSGLISPKVLANNNPATSRESQSFSSLYVDVSSPGIPSSVSTAEEANLEAPLVSSASTSSGESPLSPPEAPAVPIPAKNSVPKSTANCKPAKKVPFKKRPALKIEPIEPSSPINSSTDATAFNSPQSPFLACKLEEEEFSETEEKPQNITGKRKSSLSTSSKAKPKKKKPYVMNETTEDDLMVLCEECNQDIPIRYLDIHQRREHEGESRRSSSTVAQAKIAAGIKKEQEGLKDLKKTAINNYVKIRNKKNKTGRVYSDDDEDYSYHGKLYRKDKRRRLTFDGSTQ